MRMSVGEIVAIRMALENRLTYLKKLGFADDSPEIRETKAAQAKWSQVTPNWIFHKYI